MSLMVVRKSDASKFTTGFTATIDCGGISDGTKIATGTSIQKVIEDMVRKKEDPNTRYESKSLGTWSTASQVDTFLSTYNHDNNYENNGVKLSLGNSVTIQDGTYNGTWEIAGFDCEYFATASDGTVYNNGYGILMIPKTYITTNVWDDGGTNAYIFSTMRRYLVEVAANMQNILGSHMINRNVLLGNAQSGTSPRNWTTSAYAWTTSYLTLMSIGQMTGTFKANNNKYDDGEANYKLPVFNFESFYNPNHLYWSRCIYGSSEYNYYSAWCVNTNGSILDRRVEEESYIRPLMLLR